MAWSLLTAKARAILSAAEAQRNEPGVNQIDACGPACVSCLMQIHGYADIEPQDLVGQYYRGGTTGPQLNGLIAARYPNAPTMSYVASAAPITDLAGWAAKGWLSIGLFWSDAAAVVKPYNTGIGHWCIPVEDDGATITIWNPEWGYFARLSHGDFLGASQHQFDVCQRAIPTEVIDMLSEQTKYAFVRLAYLAALGREPESAAAQANQAGHILDDGSNLDAVLVGITDSPEAQAYRANIAKLAGAAVSPTKPFDATITPK